jgi:hypothetical protein
LALNLPEFASMTAPFTNWTVKPHGELQTLDDNILTAEGEVGTPAGTLPRRMTIVRTRDRRLIIFSAVAMDEASMARIEAFGEPTFLIVPNNHHRLDASIFKIRYPGLTVVTPEGAREKVEEVVPVDTASPDFGDPAIAFIAVPGTLDHESALTVQNAGGTTLVLNDLIGNIRHEHGFSGWLLRAMKFAGDEPHIPTPVKAAVVDNKEAVRRQLLEWSEIADLKRVIVSHGDIIDDNPRDALKGLAGSLR